MRWPFPQSAISLPRSLFLLAFFLLNAIQAHALEAVTLQLKWTHAFQFAGYYAAQAQGYYRDATRPNWP